MAIYAHQRIVVTNAEAKGLDSGVIHIPPGKAQYALITYEGGDCRVWSGGADDPTSTEGHLLAAGDYTELNGPSELLAFKAIATTATDTIMQVSYGA